METDFHFSIDSYAGQKLRTVSFISVDMWIVMFIYLLEACGIKRDEIADIRYSSLATVPLTRLGQP